MDNIFDGQGRVVRTVEGPKPSGAWLVYIPDFEPELITLVETEDEAIRRAASRPGARAIFWPFGASWEEVER